MGNGSGVNNGYGATANGALDQMNSDDLEQSPALAPILEGEGQYASKIPPSRTYTRVVIVAIAAAALAVAGSLLAAYAMGWIH